MAKSHKITAPIVVTPLGVGRLIALEPGGNHRVLLHDGEKVFKPSGIEFTPLWPLAGEAPKTRRLLELPWVKPPAQVKVKTKQVSAKAINAELIRHGLGINRGLYMETPVGIRNGKMQFQWGRKISYRGGTKGRSPLIIAMEAFQSDPEFYFQQFRTFRTNVGEYSRKCKGCGTAFISTRSDALCCSAKCRKRVSRRECHT